MNNELVSSMNMENSLSKAIKLDIYNFIKRVLDIVLSLIGILFLIPITLIIKIANLINDDNGSVFFKQRRIGQNGKLFTLYKYRSMKVNADDELEKMLNDKKLYNEYKINKKLSNDPRITKVGKFIRKTSIDELPQLINVLRGDMSLVGNRPYLPKERKDMGKYYNNIIMVKPGITGYWQTNGRSKTTFKKRLELESWYSNNKSLSLDIKIFFKTFKSVLIDKFAK